MRLPIVTLAVLTVSLAASLGVDGYLMHSSAQATAPRATATTRAAKVPYAPLPTLLSGVTAVSASPSAAPVLTFAPDPAPEVTQAAPAPAASASASAPAPATEAAPPASDWASQAYSVGHGPNASDKVVLSYDDCPRSRAAFREVVLGAESLHVALALFPTGQCLASGVFDADFARAHGQYVFNHSISHPHFARLDQAAIEAQLGVPGVQTTWGRTPYGELSSTIRAAFAAKGMRIWTWTVDTNDWRGYPAAQIVSYVVGQARAGDTVLMHMQHNAFDQASLSQMVSGLAARGLGVCANTGPTETAPRAIAC